MLGAIIWYSKNNLPYCACRTGIIPGAGDVADAALNYILVVRKAKKAE